MAHKKQSKKKQQIFPLTAAMQAHQAGLETVRGTIHTSEFPDITKKLQNGITALTEGWHQMAQLVSLATEFCIGGDEAIKLRCRVNIVRTTWLGKTRWIITQDMSRLLLSKSGDWEWDYDMDDDLAERTHFKTLEEAWEIACPVQEARLKSARKFAREVNKAARPQKGEEAKK
jgi:hypothetical protein